MAFLHKKTIILANHYPPQYLSGFMPFYVSYFQI